jgi:hypothetical protein
MKEILGQEYDYKVKSIQEALDKEKEIALEQVLQEKQNFITNKEHQFQQIIVNEKVKI